jgi:hypothetical protein
MEIDIIQFLIIAISILIVLIVVLFIPMGQEQPNLESIPSRPGYQPIKPDCEPVSQPTQNIEFLKEDSSTQHIESAPIQPNSDESTSLHIIPKQQPRPPKLYQN